MVISTDTRPIPDEWKKSEMEGPEPATDSRKRKPPRPLPPVCDAAKNGDPDALRAALKAGDDIHGKDPGGFTGLHWAIQRLTNTESSRDSRHKECIDILLEQSSLDLECASKDGFTALHWALTWQEPEVLKLLIAKGANVHAVTKHGKTAINFSKGDHQIMAILKEAGVDTSNPDWDLRNASFLPF